MFTCVQLTHEELTLSSFFLGGEGKRHSGLLRVQNDSFETAVKAAVDPGKGQGHGKKQNARR